MFRRRLWLLIVAVLIAVGVPGGNGIAATDKAKYVFLFIGDGMGIVQRHAAELYLADQKGLDRSEKGAKLVMNTFPAQGINTTHDLSSVITDSASAATAIACGRKTKSGVIGMDAEGKIGYESIAEIAKKKNWKVGILSTVSLDHATPAAFYAHVPSRKQMYDISLQLANSQVDYFAGGQLKERVSKKDRTKPDALELAQKNGYTVAVGRADFETLKPGTNKVIAMNALVDESFAMYYTLDQDNGKDHVTISEYLRKGIELIDNPEGFFMMVEGGKIDWACHAHDAAASIHDILALDEAVAEAVRFYEKHPEKTLIIVTGDHETGGMSIGFAETGSSFFIDKIRNQKMSHIGFGKKLEEYKKTHAVADTRLEEMMPLITEAFGLYVIPADEKRVLEKAVAEGKVKDASEDAVKAGREAEQKLKEGMALNEREFNVLGEAFKECMMSEKERGKDKYGGCKPLVVTLTTILGNKAGIGWTTHSHTGIPVQTSALGVGAELFKGYYDATEIYTKIMEITGL